MPHDEASRKPFGFISEDRMIDGEHDRIETRITTVIHDAKWLQDRRNWPGLKSIVMVESSREISGKIEGDSGFFAKPSHHDEVQLAQGSDA